MFEERWEEVGRWGFPLVQNQRELEWLYNQMRDVHSYLEVGTSFGGSLYVIGGALAHGARIVSVDLPKYRGNPKKWPRDRAHMESVDRAADMLRDEGKEVIIIRADSHDPNTVRTVDDLGPYEACFIDGDHSPEGVKADHDNYAPMCQRSYYHDIAVPSVRAWWSTLTGSRVEFIEEYGMGGLK